MKIRSSSALSSRQKRAGVQNIVRPLFFRKSSFRRFAIPRSSRSFPASGWERRFLYRLISTSSLASRTGSHTETGIFQSFAFSAVPARRRCEHRFPTLHSLPPRCCSAPAPQIFPTSGSTRQHSKTYVPLQHFQCRRSSAPDIPVTISKPHIVPSLFILYISVIS